MIKRVSISVPLKLKKAMDKRHAEFNWSKIATEAFAECLGIQLERKMTMAQRIEELEERMVRLEEKELA